MAEIYICSNAIIDKLIASFLFGWKMAQQQVQVMKRSHVPGKRMEQLKMISMADKKMSWLHRT